MGVLDPPGHTPVVLRISLVVTPHTRLRELLLRKLLFLKGEFSSDLYDPVVFNQKIAADGFEHIWLSYAPNPPFAALFFVPFALLPPAIAKLLFNILTIALFMVSYYRLVKHLALDQRVAAFIPLVFIVPLYNGIQFGQVYLLMFFLLAEGYLALEAGKVYTVAILWSLAILLKIFPGILFLYLLLRRDYKAFWSLAVASGLLFLTTLALHGSDVWMFFVKAVLPKASTWRGNRGSVYSIVSVVRHVAEIYVCRRPGR